VWNWLGLVRVSMGDIRDGVEAYKKALELAPDICTCLRSTLPLYRHILALPQPLTPVQPPPPHIGNCNLQVWNWLGLACVSMGDIRDSVEAYKKALELVPDMHHLPMCLAQ
jgi:cytochrome c-type biogenesis protein CcmH/NrfG